jgi:sugar-1,4-lactone oxidase-like protein
MVTPPDVRRGRFTNWARTQGGPVARYERPSTEGEVVALVRAAAAARRRVKVVGAGHSWSDAAVTDEVLVNLDRLDTVHSVDAASGLATVDAGIRLAELNLALDAAGLALPVLGSVTQQSIAGAISTGTHGSAPKRGSLASTVVSLRLVLADGSVVDASQKSEPELFAAARVGLGALGVVTRVTLRCVPAFRLEEIREPMAFDAALARIPELLESEEFVKLWWLPHTDTVLVTRWRRTDAPSNLRPLALWLDERVVNRFVFPFLLWLGATFPALIPGVGRLIASAYFVAKRRVGRSFEVLPLPMPPRHDEMEWALPVARAQEALAWTRDAIDRNSLRIDFIQELRFSAAEDAWMSPAYGRATCWLGIYAAGTPAREAYFAAAEAQARAWDGRPHWGKRFAATTEVHPNAARFDALRRRLDPEGRFENAFLRRLFGPPSRAAGSEAA